MCCDCCLVLWAFTCLMVASRRGGLAQGDSRYYTSLYVGDERYYLPERLSCFDVSRSNQASVFNQCVRVKSQDMSRPIHITLYHSTRPAGQQQNYPPPTPIVWETQLLLHQAMSCLLSNSFCLLPLLRILRLNSGSRPLPFPLLREVPFIKRLKHPQCLAEKMTQKDFILWVSQERSLVKIDLLLKNPWWREFPLKQSWRTTLSMKILGEGN